ncbi:hypothetical protein CDAR_483621 [Caerostris darwini]|uniref:Uncharacterized protein n=1 Tax=Caerostris darwini TaxID=1538125 RepID=A0AAV4TQV4_9ARAC|nr:hypothetical protein CDAR_483621 [Caerostris darwini]
MGEPRFKNTGERRHPNLILYYLIPLNHCFHAQFSGTGGSDQSHAMLFQWDSTLERSSGKLHALLACFYSKKKCYLAATTAVISREF